jgi:hypothetical protein
MDGFSYAFRHNIDLVIPEPLLLWSSMRKGYGQSNLELENLGFLISVIKHGKAIPAWLQCGVSNLTINYAV